jgi:hypothetical protein
MPIFKGFVGKKEKPRCGTIVLQCSAYAGYASAKISFVAHGLASEIEGMTADERMNALAKAVDQAAPRGQPGLHRRRLHIK